MNINRLLFILLFWFSIVCSDGFSMVSSSENNKGFIQKIEENIRVYMENIDSFVVNFIKNTGNFKDLAAESWKLKRCGILDGQSVIREGGSTYTMVSLLHWAAYYGKIEELNILRQTNIFLPICYDELISLEKLSINDVILLANNYTFSALHLACLNGKFEAVRTLIDFGCDVHYRSSFLDWNALFFAIRFAVRNKSKKDKKTGVDIANLLIEKCADINVQDKNGKTPITYAAKFGIKYKFE